MRKNRFDHPDSQRLRVTKQMERPREKLETDSEGAPGDRSWPGKAGWRKHGQGVRELTGRFDQTKDEPVKVKRSKKLWEVYN